MKIKVEDIEGRHVVLAGIVLYILGLFVGFGSTGITLEEPGDRKGPGFHKTAENTLPNASCNAFLPVISKKNTSGPLRHEYILDSSEMNAGSLPDHVQDPKAYEMVVPAAYLKNIFLNNLGLNAIIIFGAFSLLAFSMIVLIFNALHIGLLLKGIYTSYGIKLAASLILPHLVPEVVSHILSLYLAYLILKRIIVPVIIRGEGIDSHLLRINQILVFLSLIILMTFLGALIEIYVTPKLI